MKCYFTGCSPFARKVRAVCIEIGLHDEVEWEQITREQRTEMIPAINPVGKVPVAVLDSGLVLMDSTVICAYVGSLNTGSKLIPEADEQRWTVLALEALGDGLGEAVVATFIEGQKPGETRSQAAYDRQLGKVTTSLAALDARAGDFNAPPLLGEIAVACAMGFMEFRDVVPGWRATYPHLAGWYTKILERPSFLQTTSG